LHLQQSISAAAAGKHVLCEKPIAVETSGVQRLLDTVASSGIIFAVNHHLPGAATHRTVRRLIADGAIGTPLAASVCNAIMLAERLRGWRLGTEQGSGVVLDITSHDASVLNAAMPARANTAVAIGVSQGNWPAHGIDAVMSSLTYGDVTVQTHDSYTIAHRATRFDVFGTNGAILGENIMTQDPVGEVVLKTVSSERVIDVGQRRDLYDIVLDGFADAVAGVGRPTVTGAEAANAFLVANAVNESISSGRAVEFKGWFVDGHPPA
jgi:1,5-anhydro-D-fructose reductase (1,5-anhydro-D-mannitol-forming)